MDRRLAQRGSSGVQSGHQPLSRGLLITGRPVDLTREEQPGNAAGLQAVVEFRRLDEVVLDGIAGPQQGGVLETRQRMHELGLNR